MFLDGVSEGQIREINGNFPSDSYTYTEDYDYLSDSDLEDGSGCSEEERTEAPESDDPELSSGPRDPDSRVPSTTPMEHLKNDERLAPISLGPSNSSR